MDAAAIVDTAACTAESRAASVPREACEVREITTAKPRSRRKNASTSPALSESAAHISANIASMPSDEVTSSVSTSAPSGIISTKSSSISSASSACTVTEKRVNKITRIAKNLIILFILSALLPYQELPRKTVRQ